MANEVLGFPFSMLTKRRSFLLGSTALVSAAALLQVFQRPVDADSDFDPSVRSAYREPIVISSKDGVLEVRLSAHQGHATLDTVAEPVKNFLVYAYDIIQGTASDGKTKGDNQYPSPTLHVEPGDKLIIHLDNAMFGLEIRDYYDPQFTAKGGTVPLYPHQLTQAPINLHTHGLRISPKGNSDNVLLHIGAGWSNTYTYDIREDHPHGVYWYHPHLHSLTSPQVYLGLVGVLQVGRADGNLPLVTENDLPVRTMVMQNNLVFGRKEGMAQLNNPNWSQYVSTIEPPKEGELADGTYRPLLSPVNFTESPVGTQVTAVWWSGPLGIHNDRGHFQYIPGNMRGFVADPGGPGGDVPADPSLPDYQRDVQFTINGLFQPTVESQPGQTEIWILANLSDMAYINVQLTETASGNHPKIAIVGEDGNPSPTVHHPATDDGRRLLIPPATRYAIAVTMPEEGDLILEMPPIGEGARAISEKGILYINDGSENPPGTTGVLTVLAESISYNDGFFIFPTQVLLRAVPSGNKGVTANFSEGLALNAPNTGFDDVSEVTPDYTRKLDVTGGFLNDLASKEDPKAFVYAFNNQGFPNPPLLQPRLDSVEEWQFYNYNNDAHPIHIHVNDFQVQRYYDPTTGEVIGPEMWEGDTANLSQPTLLFGETAALPAELFLRSTYKDYIGLFVMHCHRLNHEDNGLMALVNIIPAVSVYALVVPGASGKATTVDVYDGNGDKLIATVTPFPDYAGVPSVAIGDIDGDGVFDLIVAAGKDHAPEVVAYSGAAVDGKAAFETELTRFQAFDAGATGGISVASAQIDGLTRDNIIVGSAPGTPSEVKVFTFDPSSPGSAPALFESFTPYADDTSGVAVAAGFVGLATGRNSIVTAPGPGAPAKVKMFDFTLFERVTVTMGGVEVPLEVCGGDDPQPRQTGEFSPFGDTYTAGLSLAVGWLYGQLGGAQRIVVGQLATPGEVKIISSGSALDGGPELYVNSVIEHDAPNQFAEDHSFFPFGETAPGVRVAATSTVRGADLLVSGPSADGKSMQVAKFDFARESEESTQLTVKELGTVASVETTGAVEVGGG